MRASVDESGQSLTRACMYWSVTGEGKGRGHTAAIGSTALPLLLINFGNWDSVRAVVPWRKERTFAESRDDSQHVPKFCGRFWSLLQSEVNCTIPCLIGTEPAVTSVAVVNLLQLAGLSVLPSTWPLSVQYNLGRDPKQHAGQHAE